MATQSVADGTRCSGCNILFPLLEVLLDGLLCQKCAFCQGKSHVEQQVIKNKPQCLSCGMVSTRLLKSVCDTCRLYWQHAEMIPRTILQADPSLVPMQAASTGSTASATLELAARYQGHASYDRLGKPAVQARPQNTNLSKAKAIQRERNEKKAQFTNNSIKVAVHVYVSHFVYEDGQRVYLEKEPQEVTQVRPTVPVKPETPVREALDQVFTATAAIYSTAYETSKDLLTWDCTHIHVYLRPKSFHTLEPETILQQNTARGLLTYLQEQKIGSDKALKEGMIELRVEYRFYCDTTQANTFTSGISAKPVRRGQSSKRKPSISTSALRSLSSTPRLMKSAFRPPKAYLRDPPLMPCTFKHIKTSIQHNGQVTFEYPASSDTSQLVEVASDWQEGAALHHTNDTAWFKTGYVGEGYMKFAIYGRINDEEYALAFIKPGQGTELHVRGLLQSEAELMLQANWFHRHFKEEVNQLEEAVNLPAFYFNATGLIFGQLEDEDAKGQGLPYRYFLGTRLLPCGPNDAKIRKFTGNNTLGIPCEPIEMAIHAFTHFAWRYSGETLFFCDLQGMNDAKRDMCLIDPQCHTSKPKQRDEMASERVFWDLGPEHIQHLLDEHSEVCKDNLFCTVLGLDNITIDMRSPSKTPVKHAGTHGSRKPLERPFKEPADSTSPSSDSEAEPGITASPLSPSPRRLRSRPHRKNAIAELISEQDIGRPDHL